MSDDDWRASPELAARLALSLAGEPGDPKIGQLVADEGPQEAAVRLGLRTDSDAVRHQLNRASVCGAHPVWPGTTRWPSQLDDLGDGAPLLLWVRGRPLRPMVLRSVALVGSRACSRYGRETAETFASDLALRGWTVVSGGAFGIDAAAHAGAMSVGGNTVLVSAAGVDQVYPRAHERLFARVVESGAVVSEYPLGAAPYKHRFLARNRLIAALTRGTVLVEAAARSGARATATAASTLNRHVMAVPGPITSDLSVGCHDLIREGEAVLVRHAGDCLELITPLAEDEPTPVTVELLRALVVRSPASTTDLAKATGLVLAEMQALLVTLEGAGVVERRVRGWALTESSLARSAVVGW